MSYTKEQKRNIFNKLPQKIREVLVSEEFVLAIKDIAKTNSLTEDGGDLLVSFVGDVLMGIENKDNLKERLKNYLNDPYSIEKIKNDTEEKVFKNIDNLYIDILNNFKKEEEQNGRDFDVDYYIQSLENREDESNDFLKEIGETIKNNDVLSEKQDLILKNMWGKRVDEIAEKYSLNEEQTKNLTKNVLFVLFNPEEQEKFLEKTTSELRISKLLAEQITEDLKTRIFEPALKVAQNQSETIPELRPEITPLVEPGEKVRVRPVPVGFTDNTPKPVPKPQIPGPELVQRPVSVPRYTAVPMEENDATGVSQKTTVPTGAPKTPEPVPEPVKKYTVDPYREPLD